MKTHRRNLHKIPETAFNEHKTREYLIKELNSMGYSPTEIAETGLYLFIDNNKEKTIAFRTDMDALQITEQNSIDFKSEYEGFMHACGHDGHMAMMLGFCKYLKENNLNLNVNILIVFQPAEEFLGGALPICETGILEKYNTKAIFATHIFPYFDEGTVAIKSGLALAKSGKLTIKIKGKSSHGAEPQRGIDAIDISSTFIKMIQSIVSREISPLDEGVVTIGTLNCGSSQNIIAEDCTMEGTIRAFDEDVYDILLEKIEKILEGLKHTYDIDYELDHLPLYPPVYNDPSLSDQIANILSKDVKIKKLDKGFMITEDFSYYQKRVKGVMFFLGSRNKEKGYIHPLHNSKFNFDEKILSIGLEAYIAILKNLKI